jgi:hypothetical protein
MTTAPQDAGFGLWEVIIGLGMLILNLVGSAIGCTWAISNVRQSSNDRIGLLNSKIDQVKFDMERRISEEADSARHDVGETVRGVREKQNEIELWARDNLVSKATFLLFATEFQGRFDRFEAKQEKRDEKFEKQLEAIDGKLNVVSRGK